MPYKIAMAMPWICVLMLGIANYAAFNWAPAIWLVTILCSAHIFVFLFGLYYVWKEEIFGWFKFSSGDLTGGLSGALMALMICYGISKLFHQQMWFILQVHAQLMVRNIVTRPELRALIYLCLGLSGEITFRAAIAHSLGLEPRLSEKKGLWIATGLWFLTAIATLQPVIIWGAFIIGLISTIMATLFDQRTRGLIAVLMFLWAGYEVILPYIFMENA